MNNRPLDAKLDGALDGTLVARGATDAEFTVEFVHRVRFTRGLFDIENPVFADALDPHGRGRGASRMLVAVDSGVAHAWPGLNNDVRGYAQAHAERVPMPEDFLNVAGGEACKNGAASVDAIVAAIDKHRICRQSFVVAIGGGAVLDAVGFAAAIAHRGVRLVRVPTTVLAQDDAALGVKNAVNRFGKKNFVGTFAAPWAVLNDETFLKTLSDAAWCDGFSEAVKIALLRDPALFVRLEADADAIRGRDLAIAMPVIRRSAELHLRHIARGGDPFESREARPLDYGHWSAHKLEALTNFAVSHGAAVGIGVALDTMYAAFEGRLPESDAKRTVALLRRLGLATWHPELENVDALLRGLDEFREHLGGTLTITLLRGIGQAEDVHQMDPALVRKAVESLRA